MDINLLIAKMKVQFEKETQNISRGQWGNVKRKFSSVSQGVNIAKKVIFMY